MNRKPYNTNVSDDEWTIIKLFIPVVQPGSRSRFRNMREIINAIFYIQRAGCAWRLLPHEVPPWQTVYHYFRNAGSRRRITMPGVEPAPIDRSFKVIPRRWVVERTYGWLGRYRRLSKDYEFLPETSEASIYTTSLRTLLRRLA